jgi:hypothetical protein
MRATVTCYGEKEGINGVIDYIEVAVHENDGKIIKRAIIIEENMDKASDDVMEVCNQYNIKQIVMVEGVVKPERCPCNCGGMTSRVTTDEDFIRMKIEKERSCKKS